MKLFKIAKNNKKPLKLNSIPNVKQKREKGNFRKLDQEKGPNQAKRKKQIEGKIDKKK